MYILLNINNKILVVESKNGKILHKYITKKEAQKHMTDTIDVDIKNLLRKLLRKLQKKVKKVKM